MSSMDYIGTDFCHGCKYAKARENRYMFESYFVCTRQAERERLSKSILSLTAWANKVMDDIMNGGKQDVRDSLRGYVKARDRFEDLVSAAQDLAQFGWTEPPKNISDIMECHTKERENGSS